MGIVIYPELDLSIEGVKEGKEKEKEILKITDGWGFQAFRIDKEGVHFYAGSYEGADPINDGVVKPLEKLQSLAKKKGFTVNGTAWITSDYSEYDNVTIHVEGNQLRYTNTQVENAASSELIEELRQRKISVYLYKEYCDSNSYGEEITEIYMCREDAVKRLRERMESSYGIPFEELPTELGVTESDTFSEDRIVIENGDGSTSYWLVEEKEMM